MPDPMVSASANNNFSLGGVAGVGVSPGAEWASAGSWWNVRDVEVDLGAEGI